MAIPLKQSTASQEIPLGYFVDDSDGNTEETGLTISNTDIKLWKAGATTLANKNSGGATHISNGIYYCVLDATDTNTVGPLVVFVHESGALPVRVECVVYAANVYDSLIAATDYLQADAVQVEGSDATDQINAACDTAFTDYDPPTKAELDSGLAALNDPTAAAIRSEIDSNSTQLAAIVADTNELQTDDVPGLIAALNDPTAAAIADAVWDEDVVAAHNTADTAGALLDDLGTPGDFKADVSGVATAAALATVDGNVDAILADTGTDGVVLANDAITAAKIATGAIAADEIAAAAANKIADHVIRRTFENACDSSDGDTKTGRSLLGAIGKLVNKIAISGSTLTVYEDDDSTSLFTQTVTTDSGADPIVTLDT